MGSAVVMGGEIRQWVCYVGCESTAKIKRDALHNGKLESLRVCYNISRTSYMHRPLERSNTRTRPSPRRGQCTCPHTGQCTCPHTGQCTCLTQDNTHVRTHVNAHIPKHVNAHATENGNPHARTIGKHPACTSAISPNLDDHLLLLPPPRPLLTLISDNVFRLHDSTTA